MKSLKLTKSEKKRYGTEVAPKYDGPDYPWWARLHLEKSDIQKLGLGKLQAGDKLSVKAVARVKTVSLVDQGKGDEIQSVEILMEKIEMVPADSEKTTRKKIAKEVFAE